MDEILDQINFTSNAVRHLTFDNKRQDIGCVCVRLSISLVELSTFINVCSCLPLRHYIFLSVCVLCVTVCLTHSLTLSLHLLHLSLPHSHSHPSPPHTQYFNLREGAVGTYGYDWSDVDTDSDDDGKNTTERHLVLQVTKFDGGKIDPTSRTFDITGRTKTSEYM